MDTVPNREDQLAALAAILADAGATPQHLKLAGLGEETERELAGAMEAEYSRREAP